MNTVGQWLDVYDEDGKTLVYPFIIMLTFKKNRKISIKKKNRKISIFVKFFEALENYFCK